MSDDTGNPLAPSRRFLLAAGFSAAIWLPSRALAFAPVAVGALLGYVGTGWTLFSIAMYIYDQIPDARCRVSETILRRLRTALSDLGETIRQEDVGIVGALRAYCFLQTEESWRIAREAVIRYLQALEQLLTSEQVILADLSGFPDVEARVNMLRRDLASLRAGVTLFSNITYEPSGDDRVRIFGLIESLSALAESIPRVADLLEEAEEERRRASCD